jgi:hypothetical protein
MQAGFVGSLNLKVKAAWAVNLGGKFDPNLKCRCSQTASLNLSGLRCKFKDESP